MTNRLTDADHKLLDEFLGHVLDAYKSGAKDKIDAIADIAHLCAALDLGGDGDDPRGYMNAVIKGDD